MFSYYSLSAICYAYLRDVHHVNTDFGRRDSPFWSSRWHTRGWTLQELIAPSIVVFLTSSWQVITSKFDVAYHFAQQLQLPAALLTLQSEYRSYSVAQRMSWAARRKTTRLEDEAYCLMGIFDVNMPTVYGEGRNAFFRLQEEIMKRTPDTSLFAWGNCIREWPTYDGGDNESPHVIEAAYLFATSPSVFMGCEHITYRPNLCARENARPARLSLGRMIADNQMEYRDGDDDGLEAKVGAETCSCARYADRACSASLHRGARSSWEHPRSLSRPKESLPTFPFFKQQKGPGLQCCIASALPPMPGLLRCR